MLDFKEPINLLTQFYPHFDGFSRIAPKIFRGVVFVHIQAYHKTKLDPQALKCKFIGYSLTKKGYKCYYPNSQRFFETMDVTFNKQQPFFFQSYLQGEPQSYLQREPFVEDKEFSPDLTLPHSKTNSSLESSPHNTLEFVPPEYIEKLESIIQRKEGENHSTPLKVYSRRMQPALESLHAPTIHPDKGIENQTISTPNDISNLDLPIILRKEKRQCTQHPLSNFVSFDNLSSSYRAFVSRLSSIKIPKSVQEALSDENWKKAMLEEMNALKKNNTWELVNLPKGKRKVGCKWVFITKHRTDRTLEI